jgi:hypothetical protein
VTCAHVLAYATSLHTPSGQPDARPTPIETVISRLSSLSVFFHDTTAWGWEEAPRRPLIGARDLPKRPQRVPRDIPADQLDRLMGAVRRLACPYQRTALIVARWKRRRDGRVRSSDTAGWSSASNSCCRTSGSRWPRGMKTAAGRHQVTARGARPTAAQERESRL